MHADDTLLNTNEVAALLRVHPKHVYRLRQRGLPARRVGGEWRYSRREILAWAQEPGGVETTPSAAAPGRSDDLRPAVAPPLVAANGDVVVQRLLQEMAERGPPLVGLVVADRDRALRLLEASAVLAAGCHGGLPPAYAGPDRLARVHLVTREMGLAGRPGRRPPTLAAAADRRLRFASRPRTAGVRAHLDAALAGIGVEPAEVDARAWHAATHADVVAALCRGDADIGLVTHAWAARFGLPFTPLSAEPYGLIVRARALGEAPLVRLCEVAQSGAFRTAIAEVGGYDATAAGTITFDP